MTKSDLPDVATYLQEFLAPVPTGINLKVDRIRSGPVAPKWGRPDPIQLVGNHITLIRSGRANFQLNGDTVPLQRGHVLFASQGCQQSFAREPDDSPELITVRFRRFAVPSGKEASPPSGAPCYFSATPRHFDRFIALTEQLYECWLRCPESLAESATGSLLLAILWAIREESLQTESESRDARMEEVRILLESEPAENWSIADLAKRFCVSESHLSRRFRCYVGVPPKTYQLQSRMRYARQLLQHDGMTVQETAHHLGYSDAFVFSRQFKKIWGISPSQA